MNKLDYLIQYLLKENPRVNSIPENEQDKKKLWRALCNVREPKAISNEFLKIEDEFLQEELKIKNITNVDDIKANNKITLWQGDITKLKIDSIVNAANSQGLGCFQPLHNCIDNQIQTFAGVQMRLECNEYMKNIDYNLPTGEAFITKGYNLPSKYVIHTVGPIIKFRVTEKEEYELSNCYINSLKLEGVIYAGGSGVYRSTDNGNSFELIFPRKDDIRIRLTKAEEGIQYYYTHSGKYDPYKNVRSILIDPEDSSHIFVLCYSYSEGIVFESTDNGENFNEIFTYKTTTNLSPYWDFNKLTYKRETKDLFVATDEGIIGYNLESKAKASVYKPNLALVDIETVYEKDNKTYFIIIEKTNELQNSYTKVYYTNDFLNKTDITSILTSTQPTSFYDYNCGTVTYKYNFQYVAATSLNNIYVTNSSHQETSERGEYWIITGIIRYHDKGAEYIYGNPFKPQDSLQSRLWNDYNTEAYGIAVSKQNEEEFLFTTIIGVNYAQDSTHIYPRYSICTEGTYPDCKYVTNGIDEQTTYGVREDPFHENIMFLLNTDLGLIKSEDSGKSWYRTNNGIPNEWCNTVYDLAFDKRKENYVYSIWSSRHDAPYYAENETDGRYGGFAISKDCGKTWDATYSKGLPQNVIPVKMSVVYPENSDEVTIYVATYNKGFFVSYDSGKTFSEINYGIEKVSYKYGEDYQYILASDIEVKDGHIFGITARSYYNNATQSGNLYEYIDGKWNKLQLPENVQIPRDIYYHNGILYISSTATSVWDYNNGTEFSNYGGGVYTYKDGEFTQIFDESISTTSVQIDSKGTIYISDISGNIYRKEKNRDYKKIYDSYHYISKGIQLSSNDDYLYLASFGGGLLKLENLNSLYEEFLLGDIDLDGEITVNDLAKLKLHLIEEMLIDKSLKLADLDQDNEVTINDLARLKLILIG